MSEINEGSPQLSSGITVDPPTGSNIFANATCECKLTIPTMAGDTVTVVPTTPDPRLLINGSDKPADILLSPTGDGTFSVSYQYGLQGDRPDIPLNFTVKDDSGGNVTTIDYTFVIREPLFVIDSPNDFAINKRTPTNDGFLDIELKVLDGTGQSVGGETVRIFTSAGNAKFYEKEAGGFKDITSWDLSGDYPIIFGDYKVALGAAESIGRIGADNVGIFPLQMTIDGTGIVTDFTFVMAESAIMPGKLPTLKTTFGNTLNLAGAATTFIALSGYPDGVDPEATIVPLVNGNPVGPFNVTVDQLVRQGIELPKLPFTRPGIDGKLYYDVAYLNYLVESDYSELPKIQGVLKQFKINPAGGVTNDPDPSIRNRTLPAPMLSERIVVVNQSIIASNVLEVAIDFTGAPVQAGDDGYLTVYVNGYASDQDTAITKQATIAATFKVEPDINTIKVDATELQNFSNGKGRLTSKLKMDYYVVPAGGIPPAMQGAGPQVASGASDETGEIDLEQLVARRTYSKVSTQWIVATL